MGVTQTSGRLQNLGGGGGRHRSQVGMEHTDLRQSDSDLGSSVTQTWGSRHTDLTGAHRDLKRW